MDPRQDLYGRDYYECHLGGLAYDRREAHWARFFGGIAQRIVTTIRPNSVFDAGCAHGFLLEALHDRGVRVSGRDISTFAISQIRDDLQPFVEQGDIADEIIGFYDLVTCIEVLEHMPEAEALRAIAAMTSATNLILFSSSPSDLAEPTHINIKPILWWLDQFSKMNFAPVPDYDASFVTAHAYLLRRSPAAIPAQTLAAFAKILARRVWYHEVKARLTQRLAVVTASLNHPLARRLQAIARIRLPSRLSRFARHPGSARAAEPAQPTSKG